MKRKSTINFQRLSFFFFLMNKEKCIKKKEALQGSTPAYIGGIQKREKKPLTRV